MLSNEAIFIFIVDMYGFMSKTYSLFIDYYAMQAYIDILHDESVWLLEIVPSHFEANDW